MYCEEHLRGAAIDLEYNPRVFDLTNSAGFASLDWYIEGFLEIHHGKGRFLFCSWSELWYQASFHLWRSKNLISHCLIYKGNCERDPSVQAWFTGSICTVLQEFFTHVRHSMCGRVATSHVAWSRVFHDFKARFSCMYAGRIWAINLSASHVGAGILQGGHASSPTAILATGSWELGTFWRVGWF